jgi:hypothetical protein
VVRAGVQEIDSVYCGEHCRGRFVAYKAGLGGPCGLRQV